MNKRAKLEREEGKAYNDEGVSVEMKRLNKLFMQTHGCESCLSRARLHFFFAYALNWRDRRLSILLDSAGLNMIALIAIGLHGLYAARYGF
jgi:hypothetical protein